MSKNLYQDDFYRTCFLTKMSFSLEKVWDVEHRDFYIQSVIGYNIYV